MSSWQIFECTRCNEAFRYQPSPEVARHLHETELKLGRMCLTVVECPHCPEMLVLDPETGRVETFNKEFVKGSDTGGLIWDMTLTENAKAEVNHLNEEGDRLMNVDVTAAEATFRQAVAIRRHDPLTWYNLGVCRYRSDDLAEAESCYRHALEFDGSLTQAWNNLGSILALQGRLEEAEECFDSGLKVDPDCPKFYLGKGNLATMRGDFETARRLLREALEKDPAYQPAREGLWKVDMVEKAMRFLPSSRAGRERGRTLRDTPQKGKGLLQRLRELVSK